MSLDGECAALLKRLVTEPALVAIRKVEAVDESGIPLPELPDRAYVQIDGSIDLNEDEYLLLWRLRRG